MSLFYVWLYLSILDTEWIELFNQSKINIYDQNEIEDVFYVIRCNFKTDQKNSYLNHKNLAHEKMIFTYNTAS